MNKAVRLAALGGLSVSLLTGCVEIKDDYDYKAAASNSTKLFGSGASGQFMLQLEDSTGGTAEVPEQGTLVLNNISATYLDRPSDDRGMVNVSIVGQQSPTAQPAAAVRLTSVNDQAVNLDAVSQEGTVNFLLRVYDRPEENKQVRLVMASESGEETDLSPFPYVDLTSTFHAVAGSPGKHLIKFPTHCFKGVSGVDFSQMEVPFQIESESDIRFDIGEVEIRSNHEHVGDVLRCDRLGESADVIMPEGAFGESVMYRRFANGNPAEGWAAKPATWGRAAPKTRWQGDRIHVEYNGVPAGENGGMILRSTDDSFKDISRFIENGYLRFHLHVHSYGSHPTRQLQINMESDRSSNSQQVYLEPNFADDKGEWVNIPLKQFFTRGNGMLETGLALNINKPFNIRGVNVRDGETLDGISFSIANIHLTHNPRN